MKLKLADYKLNNEIENKFDCFKTVYSKDIDEHFIKNYNFEYIENEWGFEYALEKPFKIDEYYYLWVILSKNEIFFYKEYECGGKVWDFKKKLNDMPITIDNLEYIIENINISNDFNF